MSEQNRTFRVFQVGSSPRSKDNLIHNHLVKVYLNHQVSYKITNLVTHLDITSLIPKLLKGTLATSTSRETDKQNDKQAVNKISSISSLWYDIPSGIIFHNLLFYVFISKLFKIFSNYPIWGISFGWNFLWTVVR